MPRKKTQRKSQAAQGETSRSSSNIPWIAVALVFGMAFGGAVGYYAGSTMAGSGGGNTDQYGRSPGDAHYGHDHP